MTRLGLSVGVVELSISRYDRIAHVTMLGVTCELICERVTMHAGCES